MRSGSSATPVGLHVPCRVGAGPAAGVCGVLLPPDHGRLEERITTPGPFLVDGRAREVRGHVHLEIHEMQPFHRRHAQSAPSGRGSGSSR